MLEDGVQPVQHQGAIPRVAKEEGIIEHDVIRIHFWYDFLPFLLVVVARVVVLLFGTGGIVIIVVFSTYLSEPLGTLDQKQWELDEAEGQIDGEGNPEERLFRQEGTHGGDDQNGNASAKSSSPSAIALNL